MASRAAAWGRKAKGVYFTLNPVLPDARPTKAVKDTHITKRALLLVDCDPRKAVDGDANSTDAEKAAAYDTALRVRDHLSSLGWPKPVLADSGNGYHLLYRIDLPNDDASTVLVHNGLRALADRFNTEAVQVDIVNKNASRITKLYGTVARKGQDSPERPWRQSKIVDAPDTLEAVPRGLLEKLAAEAPALPEKGGKRAPVPDGERPKPWTDLKLAGMKNRVAGYIQSMPPSISGQGGHDALFKVCLEAVRGFGLTVEQAEEVIQRYYNVPERCQPVWSRVELLHKLHDVEAVAYAEWHYRLKDEPHHTDLGNAQRLVRDHGHDLKYVPAWDQWLVWDGRRWAKDGTGEICRRAQKTITDYEHRARERLREVQAKLQGLTDADADYKGLKGKEAKYAARVKHARKSESRQRLEAMVAVAKFQPGVAVDHTTLNADPWLLNVQNGSLDLKTGQMREHRRGDLITKLAPVAYDPAARNDRWDGFIQGITQGNAALAKYLQKALGYALTGDQGEQCLLFFWGAGANGKTTFLRAVGAALGDYAWAAPSDFLMEARSGGGGPTPTMMGLYGRRLVTCTETPNGKLNELLVKLLTGGDAVTGRGLYEDNWSFLPTHTIIVAGNHKPEICGTDDGIWRRVRLVPFEAKFTKPDKQMLTNLLEHAQTAILAWAVKGCLEWQAAGLESPEAVAEATETYRAESDPLADFVDEKLSVGPGLRVGSGLLNDAYAKWAVVNGKDKLSASKLKVALESRGFRWKRSGSGGNSEYHGIAIRDRLSAGGRASQVNVCV
jgi:P4 family phage/plasmid primase-like protien